MEHENDLALLPPPEKTEVPEAEEHPSDAETATECAVEIPTAGETSETASEKPILAEEEPMSAEDEKTKGNVLRYAVRVGAVLLGAFALLVLAVTAMAGIGSLSETGLGTVAVGEVFGGIAEIHTSTLSTPHATEETEAPRLSSPPANEHEDGTEESTALQKPPVPDDTEKGGLVGIVTADLSAREPTVLNETPYEVTLTPSAPRAIPPLETLYGKYGTDAPVVLILHTHGTESYAENGATHTTEEEYRSHDPEENVLAVGEVLAETLRARGINVLFCEEMFDGEDYTMAYYNASLAIRKYLEQYPSISYIFDLHRDSIPRADGKETIRPVTKVDGVDCAQIMFVVGTDHGGSGHTDWADNFNLACRIQARMGEVSEHLMRPVNLRSASFNQQYTKGSLLLEMGAVASSLEEACASAKILGEAIAEEIIGDKVATQQVRAELTPQ